MASTAIPNRPRARAVPLQARRAVRRENALAVILPAVLLFYAALMPSEIRISISEQTLYPTRIVAMMLLPAIFLRVLRKSVRFRIWDYLFFFSGFWMVLAFMVYYGPGIGLLRGGALAFDLLMPYIIGRLSIRDLNDFRRFLVIIAPGAFLAGASMFAEVLAARPLVRPAMASIFGALPAYENGVATGTGSIFIDHRLGILRAAGPFSHPILAGLAMASLLPLYWTSGLIKWPKKVGLSASIFAVFSASSAAFLSLILGAGFLFLDFIQRTVAFIKWRIIIPVLVGLATVIHFASENGLINVLIRYSMNSYTAQYRRLIWEYGMISVQKHPWFGIGFTGYERLEWMISSVDAHWLLLGIRFGFVPFVLNILLFLMAVVALSLASKRFAEMDRRMMVGIAIAIFTLLVAGFTVTFFGGVLAWIYMLLGIGFSIAYSGRLQKPSNPKMRYPRPMHGQARRSNLQRPIAGPSA